jgi:hypothetical protein
MASEVTKAKMGRPSKYRPEFARAARALCKLGATDADLAAAFQVSIPTVDTWKAKHPDLLGSLKAGKEEADDRVERALYSRAVGYSYDAVKIFMAAGASEPIYAPYVEHIPPDVTAGIFWSKNRRPDRWRDPWQVDATVGIISDRPMTEEQWLRERTATLIEVTPETTEGQRNRAIRRATSPRAPRRLRKPNRADR